MPAWTIPVPQYGSECCTSHTLTVIAVAHSVVMVYIKSVQVVVQVDLTGSSSPILDLTGSCPPMLDSR